MEDLIDLFCQHEIEYIQSSEYLPRMVPYREDVFYELRENLSTITMRGRYLKVNAQDFLFEPNNTGQIKMKGGQSEFVKTWLFMKIE